MSENPVENVAITSPAHLKQWLEASGRKYIVLDAAHLVDSLAWPEGINELMAMIEAYKVHRLAVPTGRMFAHTDPDTGDVHALPEMHPETLTATEIESVMDWLLEQAEALRAKEQQAK